MAYSVSYVYEILDRYSGPLDRIANKTRRFSGVAGRAGRAAKALSHKMDLVGQRANALQGAIGAAGIIAALKALVQASSDTEDAMVDIARVTGLSGNALKDFEDQLEGMSEALGQSKVALAEMAFAGGKLGIEAPDLDEFVMATAKTAISFEVAADEAGRYLAEIRDKFKLSQSELVGMLDSINYVVDNTSAGGRDVIEVVQRLSGDFKTLKFPKELAAGFAAFARIVEVTPQLAASGFRMMISRMEKAGKTAELMADPLGAITAELNKINEMQGGVKSHYLRKVYGEEAMRFVRKAAGNLEALERAVGKATSAQAVGSMDRELKKKLGASSSHFKRFWATLKNTADSIGDIIMPTFVKLADAAADVLNKIQEFAENNPKLVKTLAIVATVAAGLVTVAAGVGLTMIALAPIVGLFVKIGFLAKLFFALTTGLAKMVGYAIAMAGFLFGFVKLALAIGAVAGAAWLVSKTFEHWDIIKEKIGAVWEGVKTFFHLLRTEPIDALKFLFNAWVETWMRLIDWTKENLGISWLLDKMTGGAKAPAGRFPQQRAAEVERDFKNIAQAVEPIEVPITAVEGRFPQPKPLEQTGIEPPSEGVFGYFDRIESLFGESQGNNSINVPVEFVPNKANLRPPNIGGIPNIGDVTGGNRPKVKGPPKAFPRIGEIPRIEIPTAAELQHMAKMQQQALTRIKIPDMTARVIPEYEPTPSPALNQPQDYGREALDVVHQQNRTLKIEGHIDVAADQGSKIKSAQIDLDGGYNLATP